MLVGAAVTPEDLSGAGGSASKMIGKSILAVGRTPQSLIMRISLYSLSSVLTTWWLTYPKQVVQVSKTKAIMSFMTLPPKLYTAIFTITYQVHRSSYSVGVGGYLGT